MLYSKVTAVLASRPHNINTKFDKDWAQSVEGEVKGVKNVFRRKWAWPLLDCL